MNNVSEVDTLSIRLALAACKEEKENKLTAENTWPCAPRKVCFLRSVHKAKIVLSQNSLKANKYVWTLNNLSTVWHVAPERTEKVEWSPALKH